MIGIFHLDISDAEDTYLSLRAGYIIGSLTLGAGLGSYNRDFDTSLGANDNKTYGKNVLGLEAFVSYKWMLGSFSLKPEVNYVTANVPTKASRTDGSSSYDISFEKPSLNLLVLAGYRNLCLDFCVVLVQWAQFLILFVDQIYITKSFHILLKPYLFSIRCNFGRYVILDFIKSFENNFK